MGLIINISEALMNRADYNILREPINDMLKNKQEAFEQKNPIDLLFKRGTINKFQETYTSSIGFAHAFAETGDYAVAPIFNTHEGFSKTYSTRTFQGGFIITQQVIEDEAYGTVQSTANKFMTRWHGDLVEYAMTAISAGFGTPQTFGDESIGVSRLLLTSADTATGDTMEATKNALFSNCHTMVKRKGWSVADVRSRFQSNSFCISDGAESATYGLDLTGSDPGKIAKLADVINQVITIQENYKDDNGKYAGLSGPKVIVAPNDARLVGALTAALDMPMFNDIGQDLGPNPAYKRATLETTPYLRDLACCFAGGKAVGFFIVDPAYNAENSGPEFTERVALTLNVEESRNPYGISYDARQRFDINVASWRGIVYVYLGSSAPGFIAVPALAADGTVGSGTGFSGCTPIVPLDTIVAPVSVVGTVEVEGTLTSDETDSG